MKNLLVCAICILSLFLLACNPKKAPDAATEPAVSSDTTSRAPVEFADPKYVEIVKKGMASFESGDIASWLTSFDDKAAYFWNNGDSLIGTAAITEYWTKRRAEVVNSLDFSNDIYLPVKVNTPQSTEQPGVWVLHWYKVTATYKTGKSMTQWVHTTSHFNANDKIDRWIIYIDRAPIIAATMK